MSTAVTAPADVRLMNTTALALLLAFVAIGVVTGGRWLARLPVFDIRGITVTGDVAHNNVLTLRSNVAPRLAGTFFTVDLARVRAAFESVPWIRHAIVRREFPDRLQVDLQEHQAVAYWGGDGELRLVNSYGEVFEANVGEVDQELLPHLNGPEGQSAEVLAMYRAVSPLFAHLEMGTEQFELSVGGSWRARMDTGAVIELGRGNADEVLARTRRFLKTVTQVTARYARGVNALESADLRHENGYAVRLRGVTTGVAAAPRTRK
jgi:cell division protein FtsQ